MRRVAQRSSSLLFWRLKIFRNLCSIAFSSMPLRKTQISGWTPSPCCRCLHLLPTSCGTRCCCSLHGANTRRSGIAASVSGRSTFAVHFLVTEAELGFVAPSSFRQSPGGAFKNTPFPLPPPSRSSTASTCKGSDRTFAVHFLASLVLWHHLRYDNPLVGRRHPFSDPLGSTC